MRYISNHRFFVSVRKIILGTAAISSASVLRLLAQFVVIPILSRLLSPEDYGIAAIAMPFIFLTMMIADAGLGRSLVRTSSDQKEVWSTCFWLLVMLGIGLSLIMIALAPLVAMLFHEPRLHFIIMALSLVIISQAISTIPGAVLQQKQQFKAIAIIEVCSLCTGIVAAIVIAVAGGGAWALIGQQIAFFAVRLVLTFWRSSFHPLMVFDLHIVRDHLIFGRDIIGVGLMQFLSRSMDNLIIGKVLGAAMVGIYSMAFQFARLPMVVVSGPLQYVFYVQLIPLKENPAAIRSVFLLLSRVLAIIIFPAMAMVAVAHEPIFRVVLSEKWAHSGALFMISATACALQAVTMLGTTILMVLGRTDRQFKTAAEFAALWTAALLLAVWFGLEWTVLVYNLAVFIYTPRLLKLILPLIECPVHSYIQTLTTPALLSLLCAGGYCLLKYVWVLAIWPQIILSASLALLAFSISALLQGRLLKDEVALCRRLLRS